MIELKNLTKSFGEKQVLKDLTWSVPEGRISVIMGPSGGGKTTLLRILLGLEHADSGTVSGLEGKRLSAVFQEDRLCENVSAVSNLRLVNPALSRKSAENMLEKLGLGDALRQPVRELSGGMKRRVAIARALCTEYDVLLADEPFKGLDEETKRRTMAFFSESAREKTVILVTHDPSEAEILGGRILPLDPE
ncbi:MAG: ATP-binding cassette domain-containing protein [Oscillospiraceae bacterium]|nr:ATP-binding cassette domain-containing protein [Oscillospiraceae bacterium]